MATDLLLHLYLHRLSHVLPEALCFRFVRLSVCACILTCVCVHALQGYSVTGLPLSSSFTYFSNVIMLTDVV